MGETLRVLNVTTVLKAAGIESFIMNVYRHINRDKVQFDFMVMRNEKEFYDDEIRVLGGKKFTISVKCKNSLLKILLESVELYKFLKKEHYDIVHIHYTTPLRSLYLLAAKKAGVAVRIYHSHSAYVPNKNKFKLWVYDILKHKITNWATTCFACSMSAAEWMFEECVINNKTSIYFKIVNNAIDVDAYTYNRNVRDKIRTDYRIGENTFLFGHVGRMTEQKNALFTIDIFYEILKKIPDVKLWLIGNGELKKEIIRKISELNIKDKVILLGNKNNIHELMQAMDCFLFPSLYEGLGIVLIEAQAAGLQVVTSDVMPHETNITNNIHYISLDKSAEQWANEVLNLKNVFFDRKDMSSSLKEAEYDIKQTSKWIEQYYLSQRG